MMAFGIIPIGTGNDFSRSIGWGADPIQFSSKNFGSLAQLILKWIKARIGSYDMWDVEVETYKSGKIYDIKNQI